MKYLAFFLVLTFSSMAWSTQIVVLQGMNDEVGKEYFCGFSSGVDARVSAFEYTPEKGKAILQQVQKLSPNLIYAIGDVPVETFAEKFSNVPILLVGHVPEKQSVSPNVLILESEISVGKGLDLMKRLLPNLKTVGTLYNPKSSNAYFKALVDETAKLGLRLSSIKVDTVADVAAFTPAFAGKIDLFFYIQDATTMQEDSLSTVYSFAKLQGIPIVAHGKTHAEKGALLSIAFSPSTLGSLASKMASQILETGKLVEVKGGVPNASLIASISMQATQNFQISPTLFERFTRSLLDDGFRVELVR